jgi:hypothetical protein
MNAISTSGRSASVAGTAVAAAIAVGMALSAGCAAKLIPVTEPIDVRVGEISGSQIEASFLDVPARRGQRLRRLTAHFEEAGCRGHALETREPGLTRNPNLICTLRGASASVILVGAHFDLANDGRGVADNWTGAGLLPILYRSLQVEPRHHTFLFVAFADTNVSQRGSIGFLRRLDAESRARIRGMVDLKGLGLGSTAVWSTQADPNLRQDLFAVSRAMRLPLRPVQFFENINADSKSFRRFGVPAITIHSFDKKTARLLHEPIRDRSPSQLDPVSYHDTARMVAVYLGYLDRTLRIRADSR